jgi:GNAT superfamily N-acetyltransferase
VDAPSLVTREDVSDLEDRLQEKYGVDLHLILRAKGDEFEPPIISISAIHVDRPRRGQGIGSAVMRELAAWADEHGAALSLSPSGDFGGSLRRLQQFYPRFGFKRNRGRSKDFRTMDAMIRHPVARNPAKAERKTALFEEFGPLGAPPNARQRAADDQAREVLARVIGLVGTDADGRADLTSVIFALEDLGSVTSRHAYVDPGSMGPRGEWRSEEWYDEAEYHYGLVLARPGELPAIVGAPSWSPHVAGDLIDIFAQESCRFGGQVPDELFLEQIADAILARPGKLVLRVVPKEVAYAFVREHHSALGGEARMPPGLMYAVGAYQILPDHGSRLVAVATAGQPTGRWQEWLTGRPTVCHRDGILDLTRVASIGGLYTTNRKGKRVPLNASSMLTARMIDLLPVSGRHGRQGCLFTTYSLPEEKGTTYLSLVSKGLRPVARTQARSGPTGGRKGGKGTALGHLPKIRWEAGPAALPPDWSVLEDIVPPEQLERAAREFESVTRQRARVSSIPVGRWTPGEMQGRLFNPDLKRKLMR